MKIKLLISLISIGMVSFQSCEKEEQPKTTLDILTEATWRLDNFGNDTDGNGTIDGHLPPLLMPACRTDGRLNFKRDGTGFSDEGATACGAGMPQTVPFDWNLKNNETVINFSFLTFFGVMGDSKVIHLSDTALILGGQVAHVTTLYNGVFVLKH